MTDGRLSRESVEAFIQQPVDVRLSRESVEAFVQQPVDARLNRESIEVWASEAALLPDTFINSAVVDSNTNSVTFTFSATVEGSTFECSLDGAGYTPCTTPKVYPGLADGAHTFAVRATNAGETDPTPATHNFTVVPVNTIIDSANINNGTNTYTFTFSATEPDATFECSLDGEPFTACTSPKAYTNLPVGPHTFAVRAIDCD